MNWQQMVLAVLVGATIGYVTNWIAIHMLFRPLYEKKLLGLHIPFTPGVIPRGKSRLANGIGEAVGGMLLTEEKVVHHLLQPDIEEKMRQYLSDRLTELQAQDVTIGEMLGNSKGGALTLKELSALLSDVTVNLAQSKEFRRFASGIAANVTGYLLDGRVGSTLGDAGLNAGKNLERLLEQSLKDDNVKQGLQHYLAVNIEHFFNSPEKINYYMPDEVREGIHQFITDQTPRIVSAIEEYFSSPAARRAMKKRVEEFFEGTTVKRLLSGVLQFLGNVPDMLTHRLIEEINRFLVDERNQEEIIKRLHLLVDEALEKSVNDFTAALDAEGKQEKANEIATWLVNKLCEPKFSNGLANMLEGMLAKNRDRTWREMLHLDDPGLTEKLVQYFDSLIKRFVEQEEIDRKVGSLVRREMERVWELKMNRVLQLIPSGIVSEPGEVVTGFYRYLIREQVPKVLRFLDISGMVRQRVEELDVLEVEELLMGIMRRELVAITWLGALLGAVLGMVMVGMQYMLK